MLDGSTVAAVIRHQKCIFLFWLQTGLITLIIYNLLGSQLTGKGGLVLDGSDSESIQD